MAVATPCQTPGAQYHTTILSDQVSVVVDLSRYLNLSEEDAEVLEANLHNAIELVLARYYP